MRDLAVVYLARGANGPEPLRHFLASYRDHPAGADHDLYVAFKGYDPAPLSLDQVATWREGALPLMLDRDDQMDIGWFFSTPSQLLPQ